MRYKPRKEVGGVTYYQCSKCKEWFPENGFYTDKRSPLGITSSCKKNIIMFLVGIGTAVFGIFSITKASEYYHEESIPKTEITTSVPAQIDTIITTRNSVSDTTYIYKFNLTEK